MAPEVTAAAVAAGASVLTLVGTVVAQYLGRRAASRDAEKSLAEQHRQLSKTFAEQREQLNETLKAQSDQLDRTLAEQRIRTLNERFATAADQLGSDKPAVRLAGVYAMAGLADDWEENRQTCVDVLCAYVRMPYEPDPGRDAPEPQRLAFQAIREVRHTVIRVITAHLKDNAAVSWRGLNLNFTGAVFDGGDFVFARFTGGEVSFRDAEFPGGEVRFNAAEFSGGRVDFSGARFSGGTVDFRHAQFSGGDVDFRMTEFSGGDVGFDLARFSGAEVYFHDAEFSGGKVHFRHARFSGGLVLFRLVEFCGSDVDFGRARFSGGEVSFDEAEFSRGTVDFSDARDWSSPPAFPWTKVPAPCVRLPQKKPA